MTKRDFFRIIIKLFGLYIGIMTLFLVMPQYISIEINQFDFIILLWILGTTFLVLLSVFILIFKADFIIDKLKLDKGFDEDKIHFENLNSESIINLAVIIIGGFLIIDNVSSFLNHLFFEFKNKISDNSSVITPMDYFRWAVNGLNILFGYLLITNHKNISIFLNKK